MLKETPNPLTGGSFEMWEMTAQADLSARSVKLYKDGLERLFNGLGFSTESYYEEYRSALNCKNKREIKILTNKVKIQLKKEYEKYSSSHALQSYKGFLSFMRANFDDPFEFDSRDYNKFRKANLKERSKRIKRIPREGIKEFLKVAMTYGRTEVSKLRNVALIHVLKDTGLSRSDIVKLNVGDIWESMNGETEFFAIHQYRQKTGNPQLPIIGYESIHAINEYLQARKKPRQLYHHMTKDEARREYSQGYGHTSRYVMLPTEDLDINAPLFIYTQETTGKGGEILHRYGDRMTADAVTFSFTQLCRHSEKKYSAHACRKYNWQAL